MPITDPTLSRPTALPSSRHLERTIENGGVVQAGHDGAAVREAQALLRAQGITVSVDGDFGPKTQAAVMAFQRSRGIEVDGLIGAETLRELRTPTGGVDRRSGRDHGISARPEDRVPGMTGADFQRRAGVEAARRDTQRVQSEASAPRPTGITLAPAGATAAARFNHYRSIVMAHGGEDPLTSEKPVVLGIRGMDRSGRTQETRNIAAYDDTFVVLNRNGTVTALRGSTHAGQATSSQVSAVGMIRTGSFTVVPNGIRPGRDEGLPSWHVLTRSGSGNIPGIRDRNHDGRLQANEIARRSTMTEILFHPGSDTSPQSIGCQTLPPDEYRRFLRAVGSQGFQFTLVDANGRT